MERKLFVYLLTDIVLEDIKIPSLSVGIVEDKGDNFYKVNFVVRDKTLQIAKNNVAIFNPLQVGDLFENKVCNVCHDICQQLILIKIKMAKIIVRLDVLRALNVEEL